MSARLDRWLAEPLEVGAAEMTARAVLDSHATECWPEPRPGGGVAVPADPSRRGAPARRPPPLARQVVYDFDLLFKARDDRMAETRLDDLTYVVFDTETTGLLPAEGRRDRADRRACASSTAGASQARSSTRWSIPAARSRRRRPRCTASPRRWSPMRRTSPRSAGSSTISPRARCWSPITRPSTWTSCAASEAAIGPPFRQSDPRYRASVGGGLRPDRDPQPRCADPSARHHHPRRGAPYRDRRYRGHRRCAS